MVVTGAITIGLMNLPPNSKEKSRATETMLEHVSEDQTRARKKIIN
jgi:hypothetical protein